MALAMHVTLLQKIHGEMNGSRPSSVGITLPAISKGHSTPIQMAPKDTQRKYPKERAPKGTQRKHSKGKGTQRRHSKERAPKDTRHPFKWHTCICSCLAQSRLSVGPREEEPLLYQQQSRMRVLLQAWTMARKVSGNVYIKAVVEFLKW